MSDAQKAVADEFDQYKESYSEAVDAAIGLPGVGVDFFTKVKAGYLVDTVRKILGEQTHLNALDIGCGIGNYHGLLRESFGTLSGVDVSAECLKTARAANPEVAYKVYDGGRLPYEDDSFDVAFSICVMHHVPVSNWPQFVAEMRRVLRPGGVAVIFEHNPANPMTMRLVNRCPFDRDATLLRAPETTALFKEAGLSAIKRKFILTIPPLGPTGRRLDGLFSPLGIGAQYYVTGRA